MNTEFITTERTLVTALTASLGTDAADIAALRSRLADAPNERIWSTSPTAPSTARSARCCSPPARRARAGRVRAARATTPSSIDLPVAISPRILRSPARTDAVARQLDEYFAGRRPGSTCRSTCGSCQGFRRAVIAHLRDIAYGTTESYARWPRAAGNPTAVRAVGSACCAQPACRSSCRATGWCAATARIGQYLGGVEAKAALLALEAAA